MRALVIDLRRCSAALLVAAAGAVLVPSRGTAQGSPVISKEVGLGERDATLLVGFADGSKLDLEVRGGLVRLNGSEIGRANDALDAEWRDLLEQAADLDGGALVELLRGWSPPAGAGAEESAVGARMDRALEAALSGTVLADAPASASGGSAAAISSFPDGPAIAGGQGLAALLRRPRRMVALGEALGDRSLDGADVHVGEDVVIGAGEIVRGNVIVVDGELDVRGEIDGDVIVVGGNLRLGDAARVTGDVRVRGGRVLGDGAVIGNLNVDRQVDVRERRAERVRIERVGGPGAASRGGAGFGSRLGDLVGGVLLTLVIAVVGGGLAVRYAGDRLEVVAEAARSAPLRAGVVGMAGAFLTVPAWILGGVGLVLTIVGILALPFWIVLFPVAVLLAAAIGYMGVAQSVGEWVARQRFDRLAWVRESNPFTTVVAGVGALALAFILANVIQLIGFLRFLSGLLLVFGVVTTIAAVLVGFGAVLLTRGGQRPRWAGDVGYWSDRWDEDDV